MKVKVAKWCRKKWNEHNLMYIYHKQCETKQKNQWNSSNGQLHWFPIDNLWKGSIMDQKYANANAFFSDWNIFLRYPGYTIRKLPTILLKGTQVEFNCPNECHTFLKSPWWEDSDECGIEIFHRAPLEKFFSNGVIFTHPRIFRRFLADISETVHLR